VSAGGRKRDRGRERGREGGRDDTYLDVADPPSILIVSQWLVDSFVFLDTQHKIEEGFLGLHA